MSRAKTGLWLGAVAVVAGLCASCAPEPPPPPHKEKDPGEVKPVLNDTPAPRGLEGRILGAIKLIREYQVRPADGFWTVFHAILGLGPKTVELIVDDKTGARMNALDYIGSGREMRGLDFAATPNGVDVISNREMHFSQGHQDQFIAEMTQWGLSPDRKFFVRSDDGKGGKEFHFRDFINECKMRARVGKGQELSWAIVVIPYYFGTDAAWKNAHGEELTLEKLVAEEVEASVTKAACGGTHRLFGLAWAYHLHLRRGGKTDGVWKKVADRLEEYKALTKKIRNLDGSFSARWYEGKENEKDQPPPPGLRINTTGHMLEWLSLAMTEDELRQDWVQEAANALTKMIFESQNVPVPGGGLYHAAHGLLLYYARLYDGRRLGTMEPIIPLPSDRPPWRSPGASELQLPGVFSLSR
jgi:hypothetical protein